MTTQSSLPVNEIKSVRYFLLAAGLINILGFTLFLSSFGFFAGAGIAIWQFPLAVLLAIIVKYFATRFFLGAGLKHFVRNSIIILAVTAGAIAIAGYFYDISFDGQWYHMEMVSQLKQGFNPVYQTRAVPPDEQVINSSNDWCMDADSRAKNTYSGASVVNLKYLTLNYFSKGAETIATAIYTFTGRIETGKAVNIITLIASFFLCLSLFYKIDKIPVFSKWLLAIILAFNPIVINELLSFLVDGFVASLLLSLLVTFGMLLSRYNRYCLFLMAVLIAVTVTIKFTSLVFAGIFCTGFLVALFIVKNTVPVKKVIVTGVVAALAGILCFGFNPYVTNTVKQHDTFYGVKQTQDELTRLKGEIVPVFLKHNRFENLFMSLFAHEDINTTPPQTFREIGKIPFTLNKSDITSSTYIEIALSGFGPFFSGALCIAVIMVIINVIGFRKSLAFKLAGITMLVILASTLIVPDCWWARFAPQLWLLPCVILCMAEFFTFRGKKVLGIILRAALLLNIAWSMLIFVFVFVNSTRINYQVQQLKALNQPVYLEYCNFKNFKSNQYRYIEAGIPVAQKYTGDRYLYDIGYSTTKVATQNPLPAIPKSTAMKISEWILRKGGNK